MSNILKTLQIVLLFTILSLLLLPVYGCQTPTPVKEIRLGKAVWLEGPQPPPGVWLSLPASPYNDAVLLVNKSEEIIIIIELEGEIKNPVTFTRFTFYNKETGTEEIIELSEDLGPLEPGESDRWETQVPYEDGEYELRVYLGKRIVAWALFNVS